MNHGNDHHHTSPHLGASPLSPLLLCFILSMKHQRDLSHPNSLNLLTGNNSRSAFRPLTSHSHVTMCSRNDRQGKGSGRVEIFSGGACSRCGTTRGARALWSEARLNSVWNVNGLIFIGLYHARGGPRCHSMPRVIIKRQLPPKKKKKKNLQTYICIKYTHVCVRVCVALFLSIYTVVYSVNVSLNELKNQTKKIDQYIYSSCKALFYCVNFFLFHTGFFFFFCFFSPIAHI